MGASWKTTVGGLSGGIGTALLGLGVAQNNNLILIIIGTVLSAAGIALLGMAARDNNVSSEAAGAKPPTP